MKKSSDLYDITGVGRSAFSKMGLQEKMVMEDLYSETALPYVYLARRKWVKRENVERTRPNKPTHFSLDLKSTAFASPPPPALAGETHFMVEFPRAVRMERVPIGVKERESTGDGDAAKTSRS